MSLIGKNLCFQYGGSAPVLLDASMTIGAGQIVGLHGYSGSGKTTLGKVLAGYLRQDSGTVTVDEVGCSAKHASKNVNPVQLIHQHPEKAVNPRWKLRQVLAEGGCDDKELLDALGIRDEWLNRWPSELSGGELQRFCVARGCNKAAKYIVADEITTMLDGIAQATLWRALVSLAHQRNLGLLVISHDNDLLEKVCERIFEMVDGRIVGEKSATPDPHFEV